MTKFLENYEIQCTVFAIFSILHFLIKIGLSSACGYFHLFKFCRLNWLNPIYFYISLELLNSQNMYESSVFDAGKTELYQH